MYDYRRNEPYYRKFEPLNQAKNLASIAIVGIASYHYLYKLNRQIETIEAARKEILKKNREEHEVVKTLFTSDDYNRKFTEKETTVKTRTILDYNPWDETEDDIISGDDFIEAEDQDWFKEQDRAANHFLYGDKIEPEDLSMSMIDHNKTLIEFNKQYATFQALMEKHGVTIEYVKKTMNINQRTYDIVLKTEGGKAVKVSLPQYDLGVIKQGTKSWIHRGALALSSDLNAGFKLRFDAAFMAKFNRMLEVNESKFSTGGVDKAVLIKKYVNDSLNFLFQKEGIVLNANEALGLTGLKYIRNDALPEAKEFFNKQHRDEFLKMNRAFEGVRIYEKTASGNVVDSGYTMSVLGESETAYTKSASGGTAPVIGLGPYGEYFKQSTYRQNVQKGFGVKRTREDWAVKFGMISSTYLDKYAANEVEDYVGRVSSVGFYWNNGKKIFDGSMAMVVQDINNSSNIMDFSGRSNTSYTLKYKEKGTGKSYKNTLGLIDKWRSGGEVRVKKGDLLGIDPGNGKPIYAEKEGILSNVIREENDQRVKFDISDTSYAGIGTKEVYTKETIGHVVSTSTMRKLFMDSAEDQLIAEFISRYDGKMGIEFLLNGSTSKRFMNGAMSIGFVQKVLGDVGELKRRSLQNIISQGNTNNISQAKNNFRKFAKKFIQYQLGDNALSGIKEIHIDNNFNIGLELKEGVNPSSPVFSRAIELESLIRDAERTNNWKPFADRMHEIESYINKHNGAMDYKVITYAKVLSDTMKTNPQHLSAFIMRGGNVHNPGQLAFANLRLLMATHAVSDIDNSSTATFRRTSKGFVGGTKLTAEMQRNFEMMGLSSVSNYMDTLLDYQLGYIQNKYKTAEMFLLDSKHVAENGNSITVGNRKINVLAADPDDLIGRFQQNVVVDEAQSVYKSFRFRKDNIGNIAGLTNTEIAEDLYKKGILTIDDLQSMGKLGVGGNSIGLVTSEFMKELITTVNTSKANEMRYLKLPFEVNFNDQIKGDMVSLINFDRDDSFELLSLKGDPGGMPSGSEYKRRYYTFGAMQQEQLRYMHSVMTNLQEYNDTSTIDKRKKELQSQIEHDTRIFYNRLRKVTGGKNSPFVKSMYETKAPFSMRGTVMGTMDIELNKVGFTQDRLVRMMTGNDTKSYTDLRKKISRIDLVEKFTKFNIDSDVSSTYKQKNYLKQLRELTGYGDKKGILDGLYGNMLENLDLDNKAKEIYQTNIDSMKGFAQRLEDSLKGGVPGETERIIHAAHNSHSKVMKGFLAKTRAANFHQIRALEVLDRMMLDGDDKLRLLASVERFPIIGPYSGSMEEIVIYDPIREKPHQWINRKLDEYKKSGITDNDKLSEIRKGLEKAYKKRHDFAYVRQESQGMIKADQDGDFLNVVMVSLDKIKEIDNQLMSRYSLSSSGSDLKKSSIWNILHGAHSDGMSFDAYKNYVERLLVVDMGEDVVGNLKYRPANATSRAILDVLNKADYIDKDVFIDAVPVAEYFKNIKQYLPKGMNKKQLNRDIAAWENSITKRAVEMTGSANVKFIKDVHFMNDNEFVKAMENKKQVSGSTIKHEKNRLSHDEVILHNRVVTESKEAYLDYQRKRIEESISKFGEMKLDTPTAYKYGASIIRLSEKYAVNDAQKAFLWELGSDFIAQNTISIKQGTVGILNFFKETFKTAEGISANDILTSEKLLDQLASANPIIDLPGHEHDLKRYGFIKSLDEKIDLVKYQEYLKVREEVGKHLVGIHTSVSAEIINLINAGKKDEAYLNSTKRKILESRIANIKLENGLVPFKSAGDIPEWMFGSTEVDHYITSIQIDRANSEKAHDMLKLFKGEFKDEKTRYIKARSAWEDLFKNLKLNKSATGESLFMDSTEHARTKYDSNVHGVDMSDIMDEAIKEIKATKKMTVNHSTQKRLAKVVAAITDTDVHISDRGGASAKYSAEKLARKEKYAYVDRMIKNRRGGETVFYSGSIIDALEGKAHRTAVKTPRGLKNANQEGALKMRAALVGLLAGAFIGQGINQFLGGSAIAGLNNQPGLGGEYYEHNGIMGKEMEMFLSEKPVKIVSNLSYWNRENKYLKGMIDMQDSGQQYNTSRYCASYRGVVVR